jgi:hypothetical protein
MLGAGVAGTLAFVQHVATGTVPTPERPALADDERAARLKLLAHRLFDPDGIDREMLAQAEQLTALPHRTDFPRHATNSVT